MTGLDPTGARGSAVKVKAAAAADAAIMTTITDKGRLGRPGERVLLRGETAQVGNDLIDGGYTI